MRKIKSFVKNNMKLVLGIVIGLVIAGGSAAVVSAVAGSSVGYTDTYGIGATTVQGAIDALYNRTLLKNRTSNFIEAYTYNASTCVTGLESTCVATTCYKTKSANSCPAGTIIKYKVNDQEVQTFHVMYDDASTITMQSQKNTVYNTAWMSKADYVAAGGTESDYGSYGNNNKGPLTILTALESATAGWSNVNDQTYTIGDDSSSTNLGYSGCSAYNTCAANTYTLSSRTAKARMITVQEAALLGCTTSDQSCPNWMNNYLSTSTSYRGTVNDTSHGPNSTNNNGYWTMSANSFSDNSAWLVDQFGYLYRLGVISTNFGARAVVQVSK